MRYIFILILFFSCTNQNLKSDIDQKVDDIISQMTLEEKVGQMTQINLTLTDMPLGELSSTRIFTILRYI